MRGAQGREPVGLILSRADLVMPTHNHGLHLPLRLTVIAHGTASAGRPWSINSCSRPRNVNAV